VVELTVRKVSDNSNIGVEALAGVGRHQLKIVGAGPPAKASTPTCLPAHRLKPLLQR